MATGPTKPSWHTHVKRVHDYFFPHERNAYKPHFFSAWSIGVIAIGLIAINLLYFADTKLVFQKTNFLASVLPSILTDLTNSDRAENDLTPVTYDPKLAVAAQLAADDMAAKGYFAHNSPDGKTPWYWLQQAGYSYSYAGQNLAVNFTDSKEVNQAWLNSPTHRANIMKSQYTRVGIAVANGTYDGKAATFVVQYFATPGGLQPVAAAAPQPTLAAASAPPAPATQVLGEQTSPPTKAVVSTTQTHTQAAPAHTTVAPATPASAPNAATQPSTPGQTLETVQTPAHAPAITVTPITNPTFFDKILASPHRALLAILTVLLASVIVLLSIAIGTHVRHQYVEVISGGFVLLAFVFAMVLVSMLSTRQLQVTPGDQGFTETTVQPA